MSEVPLYGAAAAARASLAREAFNLLQPYPTSSPLLSSLELGDTEVYEP